MLLDCVGGQATKDTIRLASKGAQLVVYGGMTNDDVRVPPFLLIFKDIHVRGFWRTGWFSSSTLEERTKTIDDLVRLMVSSKVTSFACRHVFDRLITLDAVSSKSRHTRSSRLRVRSAMNRLPSRCGRYSGGCTRARKGRNLSSRWKRRGVRNLEH